jgi:predicted transcriptional regulator
MTTVELKNILMHKIAGINDKSFLAAIQTIIESKSNTTIYKTTSEQRKGIKEGRAQIAKGEYFTNEQVEMEIDKWLSEK